MNGRFPFCGAADGFRRCRCCTCERWIRRTSGIGSEQTFAGFWWASAVAENSDTSVEQLARSYLKRMEPDGERAGDIQSF
jgi:hypothetical protein